MKLQYHLEYAGVRLLIALARSVSPKTGTWIGERLGDVAFDMVRRRRTLTIRHLAQAMPANDAVRTARSVYRHLGCTAVEHSRMLGSSITDISDRIAVTGDEHVTQALTHGNGVVLVTGHFGYWELLGATVASLGLPIAVVAKDQHNPAVNQLIIRCRERLGMRVIPMASATHAVMKGLKRNECIGLLVDQDAGPGGAFVRFMGRPASTYQGPAVFALRTGAPIVPCFIIREGTERHRVVFEAPIAAVPTGNEEADIQRYTQAYTDVLERYILTYPDHWFWVHRRWKTRSPERTPEHVAES
ncbi:MAG: lysophospholipid acyltransferase family protein [Gemmatimonadota bacterium]|nr:lysophospholipid acyltransferase family protein [Gemmatimonadota bacterium]